MESFRLRDLASSSQFPNIVLTQKEINLFHSIDRQLYTILVTILWRDPLQSMQIMSLWLWLERVGLIQIIKKILPLPHHLITALADEALSCINVLTTQNNFNTTFSFFSEGNSGSDIPLTQKLICKEISLQFFRDNKAIATSGIAKVGSEVCIKVLSDIMIEATQLKKAAMNKIVQRQKKAELDEALTKRFTTLGIQNEVGESSVVPTDERTMFVTFSKGYPVAEQEVRHFFNTLFGDCIENLYMQEVKSPRDQALYARVIFYNPNIIDMILNGVIKAKFNINGKHVWMRKFIVKEEDSPSTPPTHNRRRN